MAGNERDGTVNKTDIETSAGRNDIVRNESKHVVISTSKLRRVPAPIPWMLFLICIVEFGERFVYWGLNSPLQNYIQNPYEPNGRLPGALGRGQSVGVAISNFIKFWCYVTTVFGAIVADEWLGKFKTILASTPIYVAGMVIMVATATPTSIKAGAAFGGLLAGMILVGIGTGGLKSCIAPMCGEQNTEQGERVTTLDSGETVIVDGKLTSQRIFMWYYWAANIGSLSALVTVSIENVHSFWLAFLVPLIVFLMVITVFVAFSQKVIKVPAQGSPLVEAFKTLSIARREGSLYKAKPSNLQVRDRLECYAFAQRPEYTDAYVGEVKSGLQACKYFVLFPFFFITWTQIFTNLVAQAASMKLGSTPNDLLQNLQTIFMLAFIPILDILIYPALRKANITFPPIIRITLGFFSASLSMAYACILQHYIYTRPPLSIPVWTQAPGYVFGALAEIWVVVTGLEVAFIKAPDNLKAFVSSMFWLTIAVGSAIGIALAPVSTDPYMVWTYGALALQVFVAGVLFWLWFGKDVVGDIGTEGDMQAGEAPKLEIEEEKV